MQVLDVAAMAIVPEGEGAECHGYCTGTILYSILLEALTDIVGILAADAREASLVGAIAVLPTHPL